jgi:hypothetical protein
MVQDDDIEFFSMRNGSGLGDRTGGFALVKEGLFFNVPEKGQTIHLIVIHQ